MKYKIINKVWKILIKNFSEFWYYDDVIVIVEIRGEVRSKGLIEMNNFGVIKLVDYKYDDLDIYYIDIIVCRDKDYDLVLFEDKEMKWYNVEKYIWCKECDEKVL